MLYLESHFRKSNWKTSNFAHLQNITRIWQVCGQRWATILRCVFCFHMMICSNIYWYVLISWTLLEHWANVLKSFLLMFLLCSYLKLPEVEARAEKHLAAEMLLFWGGMKNQKLEKHFDVNHILPTNRKGFSIAGRCSLFFQSQERMAKRVKKGPCCSLLSDGDLWKVWKVILWKPWSAVVSPSQRGSFFCPRVWFY